jgi:2,4-dienoyl-CoA reductase (NADPH2)
VTLQLKSASMPKRSRPAASTMSCWPPASPAQPAIAGIDSDKVSSYVDLVEGRKVAGKRVAIIGAGGIGFDVGEFLTHAHDDGAKAERFNDEWGIDPSYAHRGGLKPPRR